MTRLSLLLLLAIPLLAQDVFVPPVPKGIARDGGKVRTPAREIPFPAEDATWIRVRSERFDVLSNATEGRTRELVAEVETLAAALMRTSKRFEPSRTRASVFVFDRRRESQPYFDLLFSQEDARQTGAYIRYEGNRYEGGGAMIVDSSRKSGPLRRDDPGIRTAMHELMHDLLRQTDSAPPLWLEEGLAEYFANARVDGERVTAGDPIRQHLVVLNQRAPMSLDELFAVKAESADATSSAFYAQSWAVVHWLMGTDQQAFFAFLHDVERGTAVPAALRTRYGKSVADVAAAIRWRGPLSKRVVLQGTRAADPPAAQPVGRATLLFELGRFLSHIAGAENESRRHYREALRIDPKHARTLAAVGELEAAVAAAPNDPAVHLLYAETLLTTAIGPFAGIFEPAAGDHEKFRKARSLAERALTLGTADEGTARGILGTTFLVEKKEGLTPGIAELERARALIPRRMDFALNLYAMYLRSGDRAKAAALFAAAFENARHKQIIFAARNALVVSETSRANALAASGKLDEAAAIVRQLAATVTDPIGRREMEQHAAQLESTSTVNRHILQYNDAIALANRGKNRDAIRLLDELLKIATDSSVIHDATKLRADLKKRL